VSFNSIAFVVFATFFFGLYFIFQGNSRLLFCLIASYIFYGWWDWRFVILLAISTLIDYFIGIKLERTANGVARKAYLCLSIFVNLGILCIFKYLDFFIESLNASVSFIGFKNPLPIFNLILPIGISFYTFQKLSYTIDVYRGICKTEHNIIKFAAYVSLFPQLVAGPIVRASKLLPQMSEDKSLKYENLISGLEFIFWGFFLKLCLADSLSVVVDSRFAHPTEFGALALIIAVIFFSFQIYGDFAGYTFIAIGLGKIMGFDLGRNFNKPYFSRSFSEFWQRWHISLSSWLRDYLYIPLGGNRKGRVKTYRNLVITMFLGGLWHGANWTFVIWGLMHAFFLVLQRIFGSMFSNFTFENPFFRTLFNATKIILTFSLVTYAWIFFRSESLSDALVISRKIFLLEQPFYKLTIQFAYTIKGITLIGVLLFFELLSQYQNINRIYFSKISFRYACILLIIWSISLFGTFKGSTFIYFQF
jgi:D-alanyl-lipoteichoic acid acyltransferase DltB (MBOAT superfamily)